MGCASVLSHGFASTLLRVAGAVLLWLFAAAAQACPVCRPRVEAGIHNAAYSATLLLVLLPVAVLLLGGVSLYFAADLRHRFFPPRA